MRISDWSSGVCSSDLGRSFGGVFDIRRNRMRVFKSGQERRNDHDEFIEGLDNPEVAQRFGDAFGKAREEIDLIAAAAPEFDQTAFLEGRQTPVFFGSAINNFGVKEILDALVEHAQTTGTRQELRSEERRTGKECVRTCRIRWERYQ